jgi:hypothetical protein
MPSEFELWFQENKEGLRESYDEYCSEMRQIEYPPKSFKIWAQICYNMD